MQIISQIQTKRSGVGVEAVWPTPTPGSLPRLRETRPPAPTPHPWSKCTWHPPVGGISKRHDFFRASLYIYHLSYLVKDNIYRAFLCDCAFVSHRYMHTIYRMQVKFQQASWNWTFWDPVGFFVRLFTCLSERPEYHRALKTVTWEDRSTMASHVELRVVLYWFPVNFRAGWPSYFQYLQCIKHEFINFSLQKWRTSCWLQQSDQWFTPLS